MSRQRAGRHQVRWPAKKGEQRSEQSKELIDVGFGLSRPADEWLWCWHCQRFFQARSLEWDGIGRQGCPFCLAAGLDLDIFRWDDWSRCGRRKNRHWPRSTSELGHGMLCTLDGQMARAAKPDPSPAEPLPTWDLR